MSCACPFTDQTYILELFCNKSFTVYYFLLYLVFMLSTYISLSLTQLTIYNLFLRAILYKEFGLKSTLLLVAILKLSVSLNAMAGNSVGVEDCEIHVHDSSLPSTSSQENVESSRDITNHSKSNKTSGSNSP